MNTANDNKRSPAERGRLKRALDWLAQFQFVVGVLLGFASLAIAGAFWVESQARTAVMEPGFVAELSKLIRPFMIVDSRAMVHAD